MCAVYMSSYTVCYVILHVLFYILCSEGSGRVRQCDGVTEQMVQPVWGWCDRSPQGRGGHCCKGGGAWELDESEGVPTSIGEVRMGDTDIS